MTAAQIIDLLDTLATTYIGAPYTVIAAAIKPGLWKIIGTAIFTALLYAARLGNVCIVDAVNGDNATAARGAAPFSTITAALAAAVAGDTVWVLPGIYDEAIIIPANVSIRGMSTQRCTIRKLLVTADTDLVTMGEGSRLEDMTLSLTSAEHHTLRLTVWPGTTSATAKIRTCVGTVDNSTASSGGTSNVYAIHSYGTGMPGEETQAIRATTLVVSSIGLGNKRGLLADTAAHNFNIRDTNLKVMRTGAAVGSYVALDGAANGVHIVVRSGALEGPTGTGGADLARSGTAVVSIDAFLVSTNAGGAYFDTVFGRIPMVWADSGSLPSNSTSYIRPGSGGTSATEVRMRLGAPATARSMSVRAITGPGGVKTDTFTLRKNGADTTVVVSLTGAAVSGLNTSDSAAYAAGDDYSMKVVTATATATSDVCVTVEFY